jgi:DNA helicase-2/ATP-dependent DNA helicase PcrA
MTGEFTLAGAQQEVCRSEAPTLLVLGGAGTGKTVTAAAAARAHLLRRDATTGAPGTERVLFLTFSRTAVTQILDRSRGVLQDVADRVDVLTFHGLAWRLITDYGRYAGYGTAPRLRGEAERKLLTADPGILTYSDLLPAALQIMALPVIGALTARRWPLIICDEFQDTDQQQWQLVETLTAPGHRLLLLADRNQMIYDRLPGKHGVGEIRLKTALARPGAVQASLQLGSYRDPTQLLPSVAEAVRERRFSHPAIARAIADQRLRIITGIDDRVPAEAVCEALDQARARCARSIGVFTHGNEATAALSAALTARGVDHLTVGMSESYGEALSAIVAMLRFAEGSASWEDVLLRLAVFLTAAVRSAKPPPLARMIATGSVPEGLAQRLDSIRLALRDAGSITAAAEIATRSWPSLSRSGERAWRRAGAEARLLIRLSASVADPVSAIVRRVEAARADSFTEVDAGDTAPVQVMNLHQTKGREADAVIAVFREDEYHGKETEPFPAASRLLYVILTRARHQVTLLLPSQPHALVEPFATLMAPAASPIFRTPTRYG